ncbi:MAG TPA: adenosine deaminase, partial [Acidimicrobiia bacterium]|nr:adenosine deaminase [Acidimicrobiia bacterium]
LEAFEVARRGGLGVTIHAGEAFGLASIAEALHLCEADRLGHGVRIVDDLEGDDLGPLATEIRDRGVVLEMCPRSNVDTGAVATLAAHPIDRLLRLGFAVTVNSDNRLMSGTSPVAELRGMVETFGWGIEELRAVNVTAAHGAFVSERRRRELASRVVRFDPGSVNA